MGELNSGAYRLLIELRRPAVVEAGRLGRHRLEPGLYVYVGSARRGLRQRVARHQRTADQRGAGGHWHIDQLLKHRHAHLVEVELAVGAEECVLAARTAALPAAHVPVPGFGATDCRAGCPAHLYSFPVSTRLSTLRI